MNTRLKTYVLGSHESMANLLFGVRSSLLVAFLVGFAVRLVPELLSYPHPIGFDTIRYASTIKVGVLSSSWGTVLNNWFLYATILPIYSLLKVEPFLILKGIMPIFFGLNACGIHYFATRRLGWTAEKGLLCALFFTFQLAALRISWDLYRNFLGLGILLFAVPWAMKTNSKKGAAIFGSLSLFATLSHEYAGITILAVVLGIVAFKFRKEHRMKATKPLLLALPTLLVLILSVYLRTFPVELGTENNVIPVDDLITPRPGGVVFLIDYLGVSTSVQQYPSYEELFLHVLSLFIFLYAASMPLVMVGFFRDTLLDAWSIMLSIGAFGAILIPFCALDLWSRWMLMLVYPFTLYAVNGLTKVLEAGKDKHIRTVVGNFKVSKKKALTSLSISMLLGTIFVTTPLFLGRFGVYSLPFVYPYFPSSMLRNTIPLEDVEDLMTALSWLDENMQPKACLVIQNAFFAYAESELDAKHTVFSFHMDVDKAISTALASGSWPVYFVWWHESIGWYEIEVPSFFVSTHSSGRISVFKYKGELTAELDVEG